MARRPKALRGLVLNRMQAPSLSTQPRGWRSVAEASPAWDGWQEPSRTWTVTSLYLATMWAKPCNTVLGGSYER